MVFANDLNDRINYQIKLITFLCSPKVKQVRLKSFLSDFFLVVGVNDEKELRVEVAEPAVVMTRK